MKKLVRNLFLFLTVSISIPNYSQVVINELMTSPSGGVPTNSLFNDSDPTGNAEWIELYNLNPCDSTDISCFTIASNINNLNNYASFTFPAGTKIPPGGYLVVGGDNATNVDINIGDAAYTSNRCGYSRWFLRDTHGYLLLFDATGTQIDGVYWSANGASGLATVNELNNSGFTSSCTCAGNLTIPSASSALSQATDYAGTTSEGLSLARSTDGTGTWGDRVNPTAGSCNFGCSNPLSISGSSTNEFCSGSDGTATIGVTGGTPPYTYAWSESGTPIGSSQSITNLSAGTYKIIVTDASGGPCGNLVDSLELTLTNDGTCCSNSITATTGTTDNTVCGGASPPCTYNGSPLLINEVAQKPGTSTTDGAIQSMKDCNNPGNGEEYIELFNPSPCDSLDISCYIVATSSYSSSTNGSFRFPDTVSKVPPLGYVSIGGPNSGATYNMADFCSDPHLETGNDRWYLDNGDAYAALYDASGNLLNAVYWTTDGDETKWGTDSDINQDPDYSPTTPSCAAATLEATYTIPRTDYRIEHAGQSATLGNSLARTSDSSRTWGDVAPTINAANGAPLPPFAGGGGSCDGTATVTPSGGTPPYVYQWEAAAGNQITQTATGLCAGCYSVTITDQNGAGCSTVMTVCVQDAGGFTLDTVVTHVGCGVSGAINLTATPAATGNYIYDWDNDGTGDFDDSEDLSSLVSGVYNVTVEDDGTNCRASISIPVNSNSPLSGSVNGTDVTTAGGNDGSVSASGISGTPTYTYSWTGPGGPYAGQTINGLSAGCYDVTITDSDAPACTYTEQVCISEPTCNLVLTPTSKNACYGLTNGEAAVVVEGGTGNYSYLWKNGDAAGQIINPAVNLAPATLTYEVVVTDIGNPTCKDSITVDVSEDTEIVVTKDSTAVSCPPGGNDGSIELLTVTGGYPGYEFSIDGGATMTSLTTFSGLSAQTYNILIQDEHLCQQTISINVNDATGCGCLTPFTSSKDSTENTVCDGTSVSAPCNYTGPAIYINELLAEPQNGSNIIYQNGITTGGEWFELYNPNPCDVVDLSCWIVGERSDESGVPGNGEGTFIIPEGTVIPPLGFITIGGGGATPVPDIVVSDYPANFSGDRFWLSRGLFEGAWLGIWDDTGQPISAVKWGYGSGSAFDGSAGTPATGGACTFNSPLESYNQFTAAGGTVEVITSGFLNTTDESWYRTTDGGSTWTNVVGGATPSSCNDPGNCQTPPPVTVTSTCDGSATAIPPGNPADYTYNWNDPLNQTTQTADSLCSGTYRCIITDPISGCSDTIYVNVVDDININTEIIATPITGSEPLDVSLDHNSIGYNSVSWDLGDGTTNTVDTPFNNTYNEGVYTVKLTVSEGSCTASDSIQIIVIGESYICFPNVFSPNGDGVNDKFKFLEELNLLTKEEAADRCLSVPGEITSIECNIFNRWGNKVNTITDISGSWDGTTSSGVDCSEGVYYYVIEGQGSTGETIEFSGTITLLR